MSNKILTAVFVILFVVVIGEIGYFFYSSHKAPLSSIKPLPVPITVNSCNLVQRPGSSKYTLTDNLKIMADFGVMDGEKLWFTLEQTGVVKDVKYGGEIKNTPYLISFKLVNSQDQTLQTYYFKDLKNVTFYLLDADGNKTVVKYDTLKENDKIVYTEFDDLKENIARSLNNKIEIVILP